MKHRNLLPLIPLLLTLVPPLPAAAESGQEPPEVSLDGLQQVEKNRRGAIYADPEIDWSIYRKIQLEPATVAFRKNWQRDQNRYQSNKIRTEDMERIKAGLAELFDDVFSKELSGDGGYELVDTAADDVLRIDPQIVDLDVYAPDPRSSPGMQRSYSETAGRMTLKLHLYDSVTGDLVATLSETRESPRRGYMQWRTTVTNTAEARQMLSRWARQLREHLDEASASGSFK